jgi:hypothetical protein
MINSVIARGIDVHVERDAGISGREVPRDQQGAIEEHFY